jgi:glycosyltransferase involved in cell wall biosynthesis
MKFKSTITKKEQLKTNNDEVNVFLLCYNESALLPHTISHYKKYLPSCKITVYDNKSTDNSVEIAKSLGCEVISWDSGDKMDDFKHKEIKNNCWKKLTSGWVIVADIDEFLCVTEEELFSEMKENVSVLRVEGWEMIGESNTVNLSDINLQDIKKYSPNSWESKNLCFFRPSIKEMNYTFGAHACKPDGEIKYSSRGYINKHMSYLGLEYFTDKTVKRYSRSHDMRKNGMANHYTDNVKSIQYDYNKKIKNCKKTT